MDVTMYEATLTKRMLMYGILCAVCAVGFCCALLYNGFSNTADKSYDPKKTFELKLMKYLVCFLSLCGFVGCVILGSVTAWRCSYDIKNQAYIIWNGNIVVYQDSPSKSRWYIPDESGIKLEGEGLKEGNYSGRLVYAEKTKIVLEYNIEQP